jgi:hypothetical protein
MVLTKEEIRQRNLKRYHDNKEEYNSRQKKYFREVWYQQNKDKILEYQRNYRMGERSIDYKKPPLIITPNVRVTFD